MYTERVISTIVELLDRMFIFKSEYWKDVILKRDKETIKYHFCISIDEANSKMNFNEDKKPTVDKVYDEV